MKQTTTLRPRILFITGTDTGVGKTILTALLASHLRQSGDHALALKPFCSGTRDDACLLHTLQEGQLTLDEVNPWFYPEPVAPLVAGRKHCRFVRLDEVVDHVLAVVSRHLSAAGQPGLGTQKSGTNPPVILVEGSGGLLVPLGEGYNVLDLINSLGCETIVVSRNKLGTINHTLLTLRVLRNAPPVARITLQGSRTKSTPPKVVLMESARPDFSSISNPKLLAELLKPVPMFSIPFLGVNCHSAAAVKKNAKKLKKTLARILA